MPKKLTPRSIELIRGIIEAERAVGDRKTAVALELLLEWYLAAVTAESN